MNFIPSYSVYLSLLCLTSLLPFCPQVCRLVSAYLSLSPLIPPCISLSVLIGPYRHGRTLEVDWKLLRFYTKFVMILALCKDTYLSLSQRPSGLSSLVVNRTESLPLFHHYS